MKALPHIPGSPSTLSCPLGAPFTLDSQISSTMSPTEPRAPLLWPRVQTEIPLSIQICNSDDTGIPTTHRIALNLTPYQM